MKLRIRPYHIILLVAASVTMVFFMKINKRNFYFHYFKVIEEVELRNSQEVLAGDNVIAYVVEQARKILHIGLWSLAGILISFFFISPLLERCYYGIHVKPLTSRQLHFNTIPIRAP